MIRSIGVKNLNKRTIQKIRAMIAAVLAEPELYDQDTFGKAICKNEGQQACGTVCCAAGWAVWLESRSLYDKMMRKELKFADRPWESYVEWIPAALEALGLKMDDGDDSDRLFGGSSCWPEPFNFEYKEATTAKQRARAFARRWRFFIKTDGTDNQDED